MNEKDVVFVVMGRLTHTRATPPFSKRTSNLPVCIRDCLSVCYVSTSAPAGSELYIVERLISITNPIIIFTISLSIDKFKKVG